MKNLALKSAATAVGTLVVFFLFFSNSSYDSLVGGFAAPTFALLGLLMFAAVKDVHELRFVFIVALLGMLSYMFPLLTFNSTYAELPQNAVFAVTLIPALILPAIYIKMVRNQYFKDLGDKVKEYSRQSVLFIFLTEYLLVFLPPSIVTFAPLF